jgi:hypothetical protein
MAPAPVAASTDYTLNGNTGWSTGLAPAAAAGSSALAEPVRAPSAEPPYVPPAELSKVMQTILERTDKLEGLRNAGTTDDMLKRWTGEALTAGPRAASSARPGAGVPGRGDHQRLEPG